MTQEQQRIAIAESCGWKWKAKVKGAIKVWHKPPDMVFYDHQLPDYLNDLNAMHEAENVLDDVTQRGDYWDYLFSLTGGEFEMCHATARQRAEAFLRTLNLWKE